MRGKTVFVAGVVLLAGLLAGCQGATQTPTVEATPVLAQGSANVIVAEAVIEPAAWSDLRFESGGLVAEVLVAEGEVAAAGQPLARLEATTAALAVQEAEAALAIAQAQLAQTQAGPRPEELAVAEAEVKAMQAGVSQAAAQRDELKAGGIEAQVAQAEAQLASARDAEWSAQDVYTQYGWTMGDKARIQLEAAQAAVAAAEQNLASAQNSGAARLRAAEAAVWAATAQRDVATARLALAQTGAAPEAIAVAAASVQQAEVAVATAQAALARMTVTAPFAGVVTRVALDPGELAAPGDVALTLATLTQLQVRTVDLTELAVVRLAEGQAVAVTVDALPGQTLTGRITRIDLQAVDYRGDVTYPVYIALDETPPAVRWGMSAVVKIETQ